MGTRSLTYVYDGGRKAADLLMCMYRQMDGYPSGHGQELHDFLAPMALINGIPFGVSNADKANGVGCLAAQMVKHFKEDIGGIYLYRPKLNNDAGQDYEYHVFTVAEGSPELRVAVYGIDYKTHKKLIFQGTVSEMADFINTYGKD